MPFPYNLYYIPYPNGTCAAQFCFDLATLVRWTRKLEGIFSLYLYIYIERERERVVFY